MPTILAKEIEKLSNRLLHVERVVLLGDGDRLPLAEIVRNLMNTINDYITQKDKEEQIRKDEEIKKAKKTEAEAEAKKAQWDKLKWIVISFLVPTLSLFFWQAFVFIFKIYPMLAKLAE